MPLDAQQIDASSIVEKTPYVLDTYSPLLEATINSPNMAKIHCVDHMVILRSSSASLSDGLLCDPYAERIEPES